MRIWKAACRVKGPEHYGIVDGKGGGGCLLLQLASNYNVNSPPAPQGAVCVAVETLGASVALAHNQTRRRRTKRRKTRRMKRRETRRMRTRRRSGKEMLF